MLIPHHDRKNEWLILSLQAVARSLVMHANVVLTFESEDNSLSVTIQVNVTDELFHVHMMVLFVFQFLRK